MTALSRFSFFLLTTFVLFSCGNKQAEPKTDEELKAYADELAHRFIITDGHVDLPYRLRMKNFRLEREYMNIPVSTTDGDFDYQRAKAGGLDAPFMSIYIPSSYQQFPDKGKPLADSLINMIRTISQELPDKFALAGSANEVEANFKEGKISLPMGMENGAPLGDDLTNVQYFYDRGIRYITLTHGKDNQICDSSYDTTHTWNGLSPFGEQVVKEMNRVGIMVDISHVDDSAFFDVIKIAQAPCIASHSSCRKFTPGFQRNMSDEMIKTLAQHGGVMQINFGSSFLDSTYRAQSKILGERLKDLLAENNLQESDSLARPLIEKFKQDNPAIYADVEHVADHIDHVVNIAGIDYVGIGSDFDGVGDSLPTGLKDVSSYPNLIYVLLKRGYSEDDIAKICYRNVWRVWKKVDEVARQMQGQVTPD